MGDYINNLHDTYRDILQERGKRTLEPPLWKLRISDDEYTELQLVLQEAERVGNMGQKRQSATLSGGEETITEVFPQKKQLRQTLVYMIQKSCTRLPERLSRIVTFPLSRPRGRSISGPSYVRSVIPCATSRLGLTFPVTKTS